MIYEVKNNTLSIIASETVSNKEMMALDRFINRHESQIYNIAIYGHNANIIEYVRTLGIDWAVLNIDKVDRNTLFGFDKADNFND